MCQIHSFFIYQSLGNVFLLPFFLVLHLFSTLKVDSSLIFSAFLSRKVCIWRCNWKNGCDAERKAEKNEEKSLAYLHSSTKELFQWYHHHSGWLSVIHFYASSLRKLLKVASAHRITEKIRHTHKHHSSLSSIQQWCISKKKASWPSTMPLLFFAKAY